MRAQAAEAGVPHFDFRYVLTPIEIYHAIEGYQRREKREWQRASFVAATAAQAFGAKTNARKLAPWAWRKD